MLNMLKLGTGVCPMMDCHHPGCSPHCALSPLGQPPRDQKWIQKCMDNAKYNILNNYIMQFSENVSDG